MIMPKDFDENLKDFHYVYEHKLDGKVIYVGKGTGYRAVSLDRNVYWKALVGERVDEVDVEIKAYFKEENDALIYESILIDRYINENMKLTNIAMNSNIYEDYSYLEETIKEIIDKETKDKLKRAMSLLIKDETPIDVQILEREKSIGSIKRRLNKLLTVEDKKQIAEELNVKRKENGRLIKWTTIKRVLLDNWYDVNDIRKMVDGKRKSFSIISLVNKYACRLN